MLRMIRMMAGLLYNLPWKTFSSYKFLFNYRLIGGRNLIEVEFMNALLHELPTRH